jgi:hypothetical protein
MFRQQVQGPGHARGRDPGRLGTFLVCHYVTHVSAGLMASPKCVTLRGSCMRDRARLAGVC